MTTSRNNTIMSWMAYTDFLSRLRIAAGILLPLNTRTLLLYPGGRDCIGAAGVDAYHRNMQRGHYRHLIMGLSQILCKRRNAVQIEQNLFKAEVAQAAAALFSK